MPPNSFSSTWCQCSSPCSSTTLSTLHRPGAASGAAVGGAGGRRRRGRSKGARAEGMEGEGDGRKAGDWKGERQPAGPAQRWQAEIRGPGLEGKSHVNSSPVGLHIHRPTYCVGAREAASRPGPPPARVARRALAGGAVESKAQNSMGAPTHRLQKYPAMPSAMPSASGCPASWCWSSRPAMSLWICVGRGSGSEGRDGEAGRGGAGRLRAGSGREREGSRSSPGPKRTARSAQLAQHAQRSAAQRSAAQRTHHVVGRPDRLQRLPSVKVLLGEGGQVAVAKRVLRRPRQKPNLAQSGSALARVAGA